MAKKVKLEDLKVKSFVTAEHVKAGIRNVDSVEEDTQWGQTLCTETACFCE
ncbi:MAG: pinensin family lanthipeptide [Acidobacteriota bacterium]|nr:pinensin family lanthipeptide [Acidobacteriota bacterium]